MIAKLQGEYGELHLFSLTIDLGGNIPIRKLELTASLLGRNGAPD